MRYLEKSRNLLTITTLVLSMSLAGGCEDKPADTGKKAPATSGATTKSLPDTVFVDAAPKVESTSVATLKESAKEGDEVSVTVIVGGRKEPFVSNMAVMTVVSAEMKNQCLSPDDNCTTPWDYCCEGKEALKKNMATIQFVDSDGKPLKIDLNGDARVKPLATLTITGKVGPRPNAEALVINATQVFALPAKPVEKPAPADTKLPEDGSKK